MGVNIMTHFFVYNVHNVNNSQFKYITPMIIQKVKQMVHCNSVDILLSMGEDEALKL